MRDPSPYAGLTVTLRPDAAEIGGLDAEVVDWFERTGTGITWRQALEQGDPRADGYNVRRGVGGLPDDDHVLFARVDGMGRLIHLTEIEGATVPHQTRSGPAMVNLAAIGRPCPACQVPLAEGDMVAVVQLGPGANPGERAKAAAGLPFECVCADVHWACATGDETYGKAEA